MSLSGNLATFSLDEVLLLLGHTAKSGALRVRDASTEGVVYFAAGRLCGAEVDQVSGAVEDVPALEARLVDACFALAGLADGAFEFESDRRPPWAAADEIEVGPVVERVRELRGRWPAIERHVPSLDLTPRLAEVLCRESITIDRFAWPVLVAVDGRASVRGIGAALGRSALEVAAALATLVEAGAVTVGEPEERGSTAFAAITDLEAQVDALEHAAAALDPLPVVEVDEVPEAIPAEARDDEPIEAGFPVEDGVSMLTHDPDALALLNRAELEKAALGEPIEESEPAAAPDTATEPGPVVVGDARSAEASEAEPEAAPDLDEEPQPVAEPRPAVARDRGALLRMFSSLRDG